MRVLQILGGDNTDQRFFLLKWKVLSLFYTQAAKMAWMDKGVEFKGDRVYLGGLLTGLGCLLMLIFVLVINWAKLPPLVPWFYSLPWGEGVLIGKGGLWVVVGMSGAVMGINMVLAATLGREEMLLQRFLIWGGAGVGMLILMSLIQIVLIIV